MINKLWHSLQHEIPSTDVILTKAWLKFINIASNLNFAIICQCHLITISYIELLSHYINTRARIQNLSSECQEISKNRPRQQAFFVSNQIYTIRRFGEAGKCVHASKDLSLQNRAWTIFSARDHNSEIYSAQMEEKICLWFSCRGN